MMLHDIPKEIVIIKTIPYRVFTIGEINCPECGEYIEASYEHHDCIARNVLNTDSDNIVYCECEVPACAWRRVAIWDNEPTLERVYHYVELEDGMRNDYRCLICQGGNHPVMEASNDTRLLW